MWSTWTSQTFVLFITNNPHLFKVKDASKSMGIQLTFTQCSDSHFSNQLALFSCFILDSTLTSSQPIYFSDGTRTTTEISGVIRSHRQYQSSKYLTTNASITLAGFVSKYRYNEKILLIKYDTFAVQGGYNGHCTHYLLIGSHQMCNGMNKPDINIWVNFPLDRNDDSINFSFYAPSASRNWVHGFSFTYVGRFLLLILVNKVKHLFFHIGLSFRIFRFQNCCQCRILKSCN